MSKTWLDRLRNKTYSDLATLFGLSGLTTADFLVNVFSAAGFGLLGAGLVLVDMLVASSFGSWFSHLIPLKLTPTYGNRMFTIFNVVFTSKAFQVNVCKGKSKMSIRKKRNHLLCMYLSKNGRACLEISLEVLKLVFPFCTDYSWMAHAWVSIDDPQMHYRTRRQIRHQNHPRG